MGTGLRYKSEPCQRKMKDPTRYPSEKMLTLKVPARNIMAKVIHIQLISTERFETSKYDLKKSKYKNA